MYFSKALEINPDYASAWNDKGVSFSRLGKQDESTVCYEKALIIYPNSYFSITL